MNVTTYRKAKLDDIEVLTELLCELYECNSYDDLLAENKRHFGDAKQVFFLAFDDDVPIGVCHGSLRDEYVNGKEHIGTCGYLEGIYVKSPHRLNGVASGLIALCEDWARNNVCQEFLSDCLLDNMDSLRFHLKLGFLETERCIFFRKELT